MTPDRDEERQERPEHDDREDEIEGEVLSELDALDEDLLRQLSEDDRLASGVPEEQRVDDEDFIQMTGLSAPGENGGAEDAGAPEDEPAPEDPSEPISFYEEGVADVDESMAPSRPQEAAPPAPSPPPQRNASEQRGPQAGPPLRPSAMDAEQGRIEDREDHRAGQASHAPPPPSHEAAREYVEDLQQQGEDSDWGEADQRRSRKPRRPHLAPYRIDSEGPDETAPRGPNSRRRRSGGRRHNQLQKRLAALIGVLLVLSIVSAVLVVAVQTIRRASPNESLRQAELLIEQGRFAEASERYIRFARTNSNHPRAGEALFQSAYALQRSSDGSEPSEYALATAAERFAKFSEQFPNSPKAPRAKVLTGVLAFRLRNYQRAVDILGDPELRAADPAAAVGILRALGRSYYKVGRIELARSSFLQAAALPSNIAPDVDYTELGNMYAALAQSAAERADAGAYAEKAMEAWRFAEEASAVSKTEAAAIQRKAAALRQSLESAPAGTQRPVRQGPREQEAAPGAPGLSNAGGAAAEERMG